MGKQAFELLDIESGYKYTLETLSNLPYVNGCTSNQLIAPLRIGDPTA